jgi:inosine-uridine nucleoside N-ribohydrolase
LIGQQHPHDLSDLPRDVPAFYRDLAVQYPGAMLVALGPLTNLAQALERYPQEMNLFGHIIIGAGAKHGGNRTPTAEYSLWQDPEAANQIFSARMHPPITLLTLDAFSQLKLTEEDAQKLCTRGIDALGLICPALELFVEAQIDPPIGRTEGAWMPDVATVIYAVNPRLGTAQSALVKVVTEQSLARGQTIIGVTPLERLTMIGSDPELNTLTAQVLTDPASFTAELNALLGRAPDNAQVVLDIDEQGMQRLFRQGVTWFNHTLSSVADAQGSRPWCGRKAQP